MYDNKVKEEYYFLNEEKAAVIYTVILLRTLSILMSLETDHLQDSCNTSHGTTSTSHIAVRCKYRTGMSTVKLAEEYLDYIYIGLIKK